MVVYYCGRAQCFFSIYRSYFHSHPYVHQLQKYYTTTFLYALGMGVCEETYDIFEDQYVKPHTLFTNYKDKTQRIYNLYFIAFVTP